MGKAALMDKMLKLIVEEINVTRADQLSSQLKIDKDTTLSLLREMENSGHIKIMIVGSGEVPVIILKPPGRFFYRSSRSYAELTKEAGPVVKERLPIESSSTNKKSLTWAIIAIVAAIIIVLIIGYKRGW